MSASFNNCPICSSPLSTIQSIPFLDLSCKQTSHFLAIRLIHNSPALLKLKIYSSPNLFLLLDFHNSSSKIWSSSSSSPILIPYLIHVKPSLSQLKNKLLNLILLS